MIDKESPHLKGLKRPPLSLASNVHPGSSVRRLLRKEEGAARSKAASSVEEGMTVDPEPFAPQGAFAKKGTNMARSNSRTLKRLPASAAPLWEFLDSERKSPRPATTRTVIHALTRMGERAEAKRLAQSIQLETGLALPPAVVDRLLNRLR